MGCETRLGLRGIAFVAYIGVEFTEKTTNDTSTLQALVKSNMTEGRPDRKGKNYGAKTSRCMHESRICL